MLEYIVFEPVVDLARTAEVMKKVIGADFKKDSSGFYEEYPAYTAEMDGIKYALLGPPAPEDDCRHEPDHDYELLVKSRSEVGDFNEKIADLIECMTAHGINCWLLK